MRYTNLLPLAVALAAAVVIPDDATAQDLGFEIEHPAEKAEKTTAEWWDTLRSTARQHGAQIKEPVDETLSSWRDALRSRLDEALEALDHTKKHAEEVLDDVAGDATYIIRDANDYFPIISADEPDHGHDHAHWPGHHPSTNLTVYQVIQASNYSKKFAALVNDYPDIVDLLNSTEANVTVFVPIDKAFEKLPGNHHDLPKPWVEEIIKYHILPGFYPARHVFASHTLPTALKGPALAGRPQRLRASVSIFGLKLNFYSHAVGLDLFAKNGIAHAVDSILVPPPPVRRVISLIPSKFSTLELAAEKTGLLPHHHHDKHHHDNKDDEDAHPHHHHDGHNLTGLTIFAPTNYAFARLGPAANAFLFNTEKGLGYLRALLKYHIVVNETLYSDAYYGVNGSVEDLLPLADAGAFAGRVEGGERDGHFHIDLPTLLDGRSLSVDVARWLGFISMRVNGRRNVAVEDGVCLDGVLHALNAVLIPPHEHKHEREGVWTEEDGEISVEELVERLRPYVEGGEEKETDGAPAGEDEAWGEL
ncbi:FAS1 domain-containing protein [Xylaria acuta]|nr:FAS1 domain-containing protein [Xylaria acuta]